MQGIFEDMQFVLDAITSRAHGRGDAILPEAFVAVCEKHGIEMAIKPTVAVSGGAL